MMRTPGTGSSDRLGALWFAVLGPPIIWAVRFTAAYVIVPYACWRGWTPLLHAITAAALIGTAAAGWIAWRAWTATGAEGVTSTDAGGAVARSRFMASLGMLSSALFLVVIVAEALAILFVDPCQTAGATMP